MPVAPVFLPHRYKAKEMRRDRTGRTFQPNIHYWIGGNTIFHGAALYLILQLLPVSPLRAVPALQAFRRNSQMIETEQSNARQLAPGDAVAEKAAG